MASGTSYNGWPANSDKSAIGVVQSLWFPGGAKQGDVTTVLRYVAEQFDARVEKIVGGWCWGYTYKQNANNPSNLSCHASGTALDINAPEHPNGVRGTFTNAQRGAIYEILNEVQGAVHWLDGVDGGTADEMHFEINVDAPTLARIAQQLPTHPKPKPPPPPPEEIPVSATFLIFDDVGRAVVVDGVMYAFSTSAHYDEARKASPDVAELHIGKSGDLRNFWDRLDVASQNTQR